MVHKSKTCGELWNSFLKHKQDAKDNTIQIYQNSQKRFFDSFLPAESIESITPERLLEWKTALLDRYAEATVATHIKSVKAVFNWTVDQQWLVKSPLTRILTGSFVNRDNDRIISREEYAKLLDACPNQEWRTIIALARMGGLRCPSELKRLRWSDINWVQNRFLVRSTKTERHAKHRERLVPLFPELRAELDRHFLLDETIGNEFVIQDLQDTSWVLYEPFQKIADLAGLGTIICPFVNMRRSRSNEVLERWGEVKESLWIGHSTQVMKKHYAKLSDDVFAEAAGAELGCENSHAKLHAILQ